MNDTPFYGSDDPPLQQGDIVLAPIGRLQQPTSTRPARWQTLDQREVEIGFPSPMGPVSSVLGYAVAIVTTHDCQMDKEFIERIRQLRKGTQLPLDQAEQLAEADADLDRYINVSPLVPLSAVRADETNLRDNSVIGLFHIPERRERGIEESVADLTYRATVDRHTVVERLATLSETARLHLRYGLARLDSFRTPRIGFELEEAVGKRIASVSRHEANPLVVVLELADGTSLELVQQPAEIRTGGPSRTATPSSSST